MRSALPAVTGLLLIFGAAGAYAQSALDRAGASPYTVLGGPAAVATPDSTDDSSGFVGEGWGEVPLANGAIKNAAPVGRLPDAGRPSKAR